MARNGDVFDFPCRFPIKVMGREEAGFPDFVLDLIRPHTGDIPAEDVSTRLSSNGRFVSVTVTVVAESRDHLDAIYLKLTASERILFVL